MKYISLITTAIAIDAFGRPAAVAMAVAAGIVIWIGYEFIEGLSTPPR